MENVEYFILHSPFSILKFILEFNIQRNHKIHPCHGEIIVFGGQRTIGIVAERVAVWLLVLAVENIIDLPTHIYLFCE